MVIPSALGKLCEHAINSRIIPASNTHTSNTSLLASKFKKFLYGCKTTTFSTQIRMNPDGKYVQCFSMTLKNNMSIYTSFTLKHQCISSRRTQGQKKCRI